VDYANIHIPEGNNTKVINRSIKPISEVNRLTVSFLFLMAVTYVHAARYLDTVQKLLTVLRWYSLCEARIILPEISMRTESHNYLL
ncbi:MAG: hypothetical protein JRN20_23405, partial [Nitrososphaerota archaeon]|nr:hypothetical protein [Nitrososphaerota archaeon]